MSHVYMLKDKQKVPMAKMAIHTYIFYNIFQVIFEGGKYNFFHSQISRKLCVGFYLTKFLTRCNQ